MCKAAVSTDTDFFVEDFEVRKESMSYTIETVEALKGLLYPKDEKIHWLLGWDAFIELHTWHRVEELVEKCNFVVMCSEKDKDLPYKENIYSKAKTILVKIPHIDIRSTLIRERIKKGLSIRGMVPDHVETYIRQHGLYK
jgi:nicotinate-nucleotide adenylyltransferase